MRMDTVIDLTSDRWRILAAGGLGEGRGRGETWGAGESASYRVEASAVLYVLTRRRSPIFLSYASFSTSRLASSYAWEKNKMEGKRGRGIIKEGSGEQWQSDWRAVLLLTCVRAMESASLPSSALLLLASTCRREGKD